MVPQGVVVREVGRAVSQIAISSRYLVWEAAAPESQNIPVLRQRDLRTGEVTTLAVDVLPDYGVASTRKWVVYANQSPSGRVRLVAVHHDGSSQVTLNGYLAAPIDSRGEAVAWAGVDGSNFDVVVRDMRSGSEWLAASPPRCSSGRCYRIDAVSLAARGVAFDKGAVGPQPSIIVRRAFNAGSASSAPVPHDPQPDIAPSSTGALYYRYFHGWYAWNFGASRPHETIYRGATPPPVLRSEGRRFFLAVSNAGCDSGVVARAGRGPKTVVQPANVIARFISKGRARCAHVTDLAWTGRQVLTAWSLESVRAENNHTDAGLLGLVIATPPLHH
jgi:hypothetical protein